MALQLPNGNVVIWSAFTIGSGGSSTATFNIYENAAAVSNGDPPINTAQVNFTAVICQTATRNASYDALKLVEGFTEATEV